MKAINLMKRLCTTFFITVTFLGTTSHVYSMRGAQAARSTHLSAREVVELSEKATRARIIMEANEKRLFLQRRQEQIEAKKRIQRNNLLKEAELSRNPVEDEEQEVRQKYLFPILKDALKTNDTACLRHLALKPESLETALACKDYVMVDALLKHGGDKNIVLGEKGKKALREAIEDKSRTFEAFACYLVDLGIDIKHRISTDETFAHWAIKHNKPILFATILEKLITQRVIINSIIGKARAASTIKDSIANKDIKIYMTSLYESATKDADYLCKEVSIYREERARACSRVSSLKPRNLRSMVAHCRETDSRPSTAQVTDQDPSRNTNEELREFTSSIAYRTETASAISQTPQIPSGRISRTMASLQVTRGRNNNDIDALSERLSFVRVDTESDDDTPKPIRYANHQVPVSYYVRNEHVLDPKADISLQRPEGVLIPQSSLTIPYGIGGGR